jgi:hypothetical protein
MKNTLCAWGCGRKTGNRSRICDPCWHDRERIYVARRAIEAAAEKRPVSEARRAALDQARARKADELLKHLPATALS